jgi:hypothetical protein
MIAIDPIQRAVFHLIVIDGLALAAREVQTGSISAASAASSPSWPRRDFGRSP